MSRNLTIRLNDEVIETLEIPEVLDRETAECDAENYVQAYAAQFGYQAEQLTYSTVNVGTFNQMWSEIQRAHKYVETLAAGDLVNKCGRLFRIITPWDGEQAIVADNRTNHLFCWGCFDFPEYNQF